MRRRVTHPIGSVTTRSKFPPPEIEQAHEAFMRSINESTIPAERIVALRDFVEGTYLPNVQRFNRPSTYRVYRDLWKLHLKPHCAMAQLRDVRTYHVQRWLDSIGKSGLGRNSLKHAKSVLSAIFKAAKQGGFFEGLNPVQDTRTNPDAVSPRETVAHSLADIQAILAVLPEPAATAFAVAAFCGLRVGEVEALRWEDYHDGKMHISRSIWNGHASGPKTRKSCAPVPVIPQLAQRLSMHRLHCRNPESGPIFANTKGGPLSMNNVLGRSILPVLNRCALCGKPAGKPHLKADHQHVRDARLPTWRGWHAARRGLGSNLYALGVQPKVIQLILRHSDVKTTETYYVKPFDIAVTDAMAQLERQLPAVQFAAEPPAQVLRDSDRTLKQFSGAQPESVN